MQAQILDYNSDVEKSTAPIFEKLSDQIDESHWRTLAPYIHEINRLKKEKNAIVIAHNYMTPEIFHGVADIVGDSLALAQKAAHTKADIIVQATVHFMAETTKIIAPEKTVLLPDMRAGCSLADSITAADIRLLKEKYPGLPVVTYVNTSAEVKAECDYCCTSGNALQIVDAIPSDEIIFVPDEYLGKYVQSQTSKKLHIWKGHCEVHERFTAEDIRNFRVQDENITVLAHPECPPEVLAEADFTGSTKQMIDYVEGKRPAKVVMITECSMSDNVAATNRDIEFVRPCQLCPHMKRITLPKILHSLQTMTTEIVVDEAIAGRARLSVQRMLDLS